MPHRWYVDSAPIDGEYKGKLGKVFSAWCTNPDCGATTVFPVFPSDFKGIIAPDLGPCTSVTAATAGNSRDFVPENDTQGKEARSMAGKGGGAANVTRAHYYEEHRQDILSDSQKLGKAETLKKWGIPLSTWRGLQKRWNGNGNNGHHHDEQELAATTLIATSVLPTATRDALEDVTRKRLADILRKVAEAEGSTEFARGMRLAARLVEVVW